MSEPYEPQPETPASLDPLLARKELNNLKETLEHMAADPFDTLAKKYPDYKDEILWLKDNVQAICYEYVSRKDRPYAKEFLPLCITTHTWSLLYAALKQGNNDLISAINNALASIDTNVFATSNIELFHSLSDTDLQILHQKNAIESKKPAVLAWIEYTDKDTQIWGICVEVCKRIACLWAFNAPSWDVSLVSQRQQFASISDKIASYISIEINKRNITNRWTYNKQKNIEPTINHVHGLSHILSEAHSNPYFMKWLANLCKHSPKMTEHRISILAYGTQKVVWEIDIFMETLDTNQQMSVFAQTLSNYNILPDSRDPLYNTPNTEFKLWLLKRYLKLKDNPAFSSISTEQALTKWLRDENQTLDMLYFDMKNIEHALWWTSDPDKKILYQQQIKDLQGKMITKSSLAYFLTYDTNSPFIQDILKDKYARQMLVHTIGSELWYLLEDTWFLDSEKWKKILTLCFEWLTSAKDDQDLRQIETSVQHRITNKRAKEWYLYPHQELIYTYWMRNTLMLYHELSEHPQQILIWKTTHPIVSSASLLAWVLQRYQKDTYKNPYRTIESAQIKNYIQQLQQDIAYFAAIPETAEQKKQTSIITLYPGKGDDPNGAFNNYTTYINTLKTQWYGEVIAISSDKYEKKTDNPTEKYWPDKFIEDVQKKIGTQIIGPLKASQHPKFLHIMIALHGGEDGSAQMWKTPFTRQHFEKLANFSETIKKQYPQSAQYFSLTIDSCFSGNKFDEHPNFVSNIGLASSANVGTSKQTYDMIHAYDPKNQADLNGDTSISRNEARLYTILQNPDKYMPTSFWDPRTGKTTVLF